MILRVRVVLKRTVVGDYRLYDLSGSSFSESSEKCLSVDGVCFICLPV